MGVGFGVSLQREHQMAAGRALASLARVVELVKFDPNQPRTPVGQTGGGRWSSTNGDVQVITPQTIIARARRMQLSARRDRYESYLDLCYPLLERLQRPGSDRNEADFHRCMNACLNLR